MASFEEMDNDPRNPINFDYDSLKEEPEKPCLLCGALCNGDFCDTLCEEDYNELPEDEK